MIFVKDILSQHCIIYHNMLYSCCLYVGDFMITNEKKIIRKLSLINVMGNILLSIAKLVAGFLGNSTVLISDGIHSFTDVVNIFIAYAGVRMSKKLPDKDHPYGHERHECVASLVLGIIILLTGLGIGKLGVESIILGHYKNLKFINIFPLLVAVFSIITKGIMFLYTRYYSKKIDSSAFMATALDHLSDTFASTGALIGILGVMAGFPVLEPIASIIICLLIIKESYEILKDALRKLLDTSVDESYEETLRVYIEKQEDVICVDMLQTRMFGNKIYVDLEIQVDGDKSLRESHDIAERIHENVEEDFPNIKHIMIHLNPDN